jgi:hypothetical protein
MSDSPGTAADNVRRERRKLFDRLTTKLRAIDKFTAEELFKLYNSHEATFSARSKQRKREKTHADFDPKKSATWRLLLFAQNDPPKNPDRPAARLKLILEHFGIMGVPNVPAEPADSPEWNVSLQEIIDRLGPKPALQPLDAHNLIYIGGSKEAVEKFRLTCKGATSVYNTVFVRSHEDSATVFNMVPTLEEIKRDLLSTGQCNWQDIVLPDELDNYLALRSQMSDELRKRNKASVLSHNLPFFQCLVYKFDQSRGAALVGWMFRGCSKDRVYFTEDGDTVEYFLEYMRHLYRIAKKLKD